MEKEEKEEDTDKSMDLSGNKQTDDEASIPGKGAKKAEKMKYGTQTHHSPHSIKLLIYNHASLVHMDLTQYSLKAGLHKFKDKGTEVVVNEFKQLHDMRLFKPNDIDSLTDKDKEHNLESLAVINEKQDSRIKCRVCANGSK
eukprot:2813255-Ditylum_brightwellii.AAC.1